MYKVPNHILNGAFDTRIIQNQNQIIESKINSDGKFKESKQALRTKEYRF